MEMAAIASGGGGYLAGLFPRRQPRLFLYDAGRRIGRCLLFLYAAGCRLVEVPRPSPPPRAADRVRETSGRRLLLCTAGRRLLLYAHFHLDHAASLPYFLEKTTFKGRVFMTHATKAIYRLLLQDYVKVSKVSVEDMMFDEQDIIRSMDKIESSLLLTGGREVIY